MVIQKYLPHNQMHQFWEYSLLLAGPRYFPFIRGYRFQFTGDLAINLESLRVMMPDCNQGCQLTGSFSEISLTELQARLHDPFSWKIDFNGVLERTTNEQLIQARISVFLHILRTNFPGKSIERIFFYTPGEGDFFVETTMWYFCFVVLINGKLVLVYGKTWPSWAACKPDNDYEEDWRAWRKLL